MIKPLRTATVRHSCVGRTWPSNGEKIWTAQKKGRMRESEKVELIRSTLKGKKRPAVECGRYVHNQEMTCAQSRNITATANCCYLNNNKWHKYFGVGRKAGNVSAP